MQVLPPYAHLENPGITAPLRFKNKAINKRNLEDPIFSVIWTCEGKFALSGDKDGNFVVWNGQHYKFESIKEVIWECLICINRIDHIEDFIK